MEQWNRFWRWWISELSSFIPRTDPRVSAHRKLPFELHLGGSGATLYRHQNLRAPLDPDNRIAFAPSLSELVAAQRQVGKAVLSFDDKLTLQKSMPLAPSLLGDADEIIAHELTQATPFKPGQTLQLWQKREPDQIEYAVLRLADIRGGVEVARNNGIQIEAVAFRPQQQQAWRQLRSPAGGIWKTEVNDRWRKIAVFSILAAVVSFGAFAFAQYSKNSYALDLVSRRIEEVRPKALERRKEIDFISTEVKVLSTLADERAAKPQLVGTWEALSRIFPDDTWLQSLTFRDNKFQIEGNAKNAEALISLVENSPAFKDAKFTAPVIDQQSAGSRFVMSFEIEGPP
jgi:general secretion pathway protein L